MKTAIRAAFDVEAEDWVKARCINIYDGETHTTFTDEEHTVSPFDLLTSGVLEMFSIAERGGPKQFWAHNFGKYDGTLLFPILVELGARLEAIMAGGRCICMTAELDGTRIKFYDSYAVIPAALDKAAKSFGLPVSKLFQKKDYSKVRYWSKEFMTRGCRIDCELVLDLLENLEHLIVEKGGKLRATAASTALTVLRAKGELSDVSKLRVNNWCRPAYYGGRVEVFTHLPRNPVICYDINSSYPYSLAGELPQYPTKFKHNPRDIDLQESSIYEATATVPKNTYIPCLPVKVDGLFFPTGKITGKWSGLELKFAVQHGLAKIEKLHAVQSFTKGSPFTAFVETLFQEKATTEGARKEVAKLLLNSAYGKLGEKPEKSKLIVVSPEEGSEICREDLVKNRQNVHPIRPGDLRFLQVDHFQWSKQTHYAQAATVTARSRVLLAFWLLKCQDTLAYCDTDSIHSGRDNLPVTKDLGGLKLERIGMGSYYAPKLYSIRTASEVIFHTKGFYLPKVTAEEGEHELKRQQLKELSDTFENVADGKEVSQHRLKQLKTQFARGSEPESKDFLKEWKGISNKRKCINKRGETIPWDIKELQEGKHEKQKSPLFKKSAKR